jgi:superfamily II DNA/RNA helicase
MTNDFKSFGLPPKLMQALSRMKFDKPTPIQAAAIPLALAGKDVLGTAQTGTGKTAAFGIPLVVRLLENPTMKAVIMTPTRELAAQVMKTLQQIIPDPSLQAVLLIGGEPMPKQLRVLRMNPRLIIGTPGRINDHLERKTLKLDKTGVLVLDETDRMLDMGFGVQIEKIIKHIPQQRQTLMFSATMPAAIVKLSGKYLNRPERVSMGETNKAAAKIKEEMVQVSEGEKYTELLVQLEKRKGSIIVFARTKYGTERLAKRLVQAHFEADAIHGDLRQRQRDRVIEGFRNRKCRILVATDVAARGLDIPHIEHVINYDLPQAPEDYIHRIGRTARAGAEGEALSLVTPGESGMWRAIQRLMHPGTAQPHVAGGGGGGYKGGKGGPRQYDKKRRFGEGRPPHRGGDKRHEGRSEGRSEGGRSEGARSETRSFAKPARSEGRSEGGRSERPEGRSFAKPHRSEGRPEGRSFARPERSEGRSEGGRSEGRPEGRSFAKPHHRSEGRPEGRSFARPERSEGRSEGGRTEGRSEGRSEGRPHGKPHRHKPAGGHGGGQRHQGGGDRPKQHAKKH